MSSAINTPAAKVVASPSLETAPLVPRLTLLKVVTSRGFFSSTPISVAHVSAVYGRWDLVVDIEAEDLPSMTHVVVEKIRTNPGVQSTETLVTTAI